MFLVILLSMIYGIKRKGNKFEKKRQNYNYSDEEIEEDISSKNNSKSETVHAKKPINKNTSIGYSFTEIEGETYDSVINKKCNRPNNTIYFPDDEDIDIRFQGNYMQSTKGHYTNDKLKLMKDNLKTKRLDEHLVNNDEIDDFYTGNYDEIPGSSNFNEINENSKIKDELYDEIDNGDLERKIEQVKRIREKKREINHKEENYDQDFVETQNIKSNDYLGNIYKILHKEKKDIHLEKGSDDDDVSDKELKQWELNKISQGLATHWVNKKGESNLHTKKNEMHYNTLSSNIKDMFRINLDWDIFLIKDQLNIEISQNEKKLEQSIRKINQIETHNKNYHLDKTEAIKKIDHYVNQYQKLHDIYVSTVLDFKGNKQISDDFAKSFNDLDIYISEDN